MENETHNTVVSLEDFKKIKIRIGTIVSAERIPDTDKLLKLSVDLGEGKPRQVVSGIAAYFPEPSELVGVQCAFAANLAPRIIRGEESNGMILAASGDDAFSLLSPRKPVPAGSSVL